MHTNKTYTFETKEQASAFVKQQRANIPLNEDRYVSGPHFIDQDEIFKNMKWASKGLKYWSVTVERYW